MHKSFAQLITTLLCTEMPPTVTLDDLAERLEEPVERIADALDAIKMLRGELPYVNVASRAPEFIFHSVRTRRPRVSEGCALPRGHAGDCV